MDNKEAIIQATIKLIEEKGEHLEEVTVREICKRAGVGLGLVNYHFGNKDKLIEQCIERMINGTVEHFQNIREKTDGFTPFEKLEYETPSLAISLYGEYRHLGIGTALMKAILHLLKEKGYKQTSLSVQKENYAVNMYQKIGFKVVSETEEEYIMVCELQ